MENRTISRKAVRELVALHHEEMMKAIESGENPHQLALDQQDAMIEDHMADMSDDEKARFFDIYAEESNALAAQLEVDAQRLLAETERTNQAAENTGKVIGGVIIFFIVLFVLFNIFE